MSSGRQTGATAWRELLPADPLPWLLSGEEASARWLALSRLTDAGGRELRRAREASRSSAEAEALLRRLPDWQLPQVFGGHNSPSFAPNLLLLLADMGLEAGDDERVDRILDAMLRHQDGDGRFRTLVAGRGRPEASWSSLLCDHHAVLEVLLRFDRGEDPGVLHGLRRTARDLVPTAQGPAWPCIADEASGFRGPGRKGDCCPMVTLQALRAFSLVPAGRRPSGLLDAARTLLAIWRRRGEIKPYMFGHGARFKAVKWPPTWYSSLALLDALARYPEVWDEAADARDGRAVAEIAACLIAYNLDGQGRVTPRFCFSGLEELSFGQKRRPSALATAQLCVVLRRLEPLAAEIGAVDVLGLGSSKGGTGTPVPPRA